MVFLDGFNIFRKDRSIGGGGVFVALSSRLAICDKPLLDADTELVWVGLEFLRGPPSYICAHIIGHLIQEHNP